MMEMVHELTPEEFCAIQKSVGFGVPNAEQAKKALSNSVYVTGMRVDGRVVGMGRLVGDMARIAYVQDLFIMPEYQRRGIGSRILEDLLDHVRKNAVPGTAIRVGLMAASGKEGFYEKHGFHARPNEREGCGMMRSIDV